MWKYMMKDLYQAASDRASEIVQECDVLSDAFTNGGDTMEKKSVGHVFGAIIKVIGGLFLLLAGAIAMANDTPFKILDFRFPGAFLGVLFLVWGAVWIFSGVFYIYKAIKRVKGKIKAKAARTVGIKVSSEMNTLEMFDQKLISAIEKGEDMVITPKAYLETQFLDLQNEVAKNSRNDDRINRRTYTIGWGILFAFTAIAVYPFVLRGYAMDCGVTSGALAGAAYVLLALLIVKSLTTLDRWFGSKAKLIASAVFGGYQVAVLLGLLIKGVFSGIPEAFASGDAGEIIGVLLFNFPVISMMITTVSVLLLIARSRFDLIVVRERETSFVQDLSDGTNRTVQINKISASVIFKSFLGLCIAILMGHWMGIVVEKGFCFGSVLRYLGVLVGYLTITTLMDLDDGFYYVYGMMTRYMRWVLFAAYASTVLALVPEIKVGTIILLATTAMASLGGSAVAIDERPAT